MYAPISAPIQAHSVCRCPAVPLFPRSPPPLSLTPVSTSLSLPPFSSPAPLSPTSLPHRSPTSLSPSPLFRCATTHPICHAARELVLEKYPDLGIKVGEEHFSNYGGNMKAWCVGGRGSRRPALSASPLSPPPSWTGTRLSHRPLPLPWPIFRTPFRLLPYRPLSSLPRCRCRRDAAQV